MQLQQLASSISSHQTADKQPCLPSMDESYTLSQNIWVSTGETKLEFIFKTWSYNTKFLVEISSLSLDSSGSQSSLCQL